MRIISGLYKGRVLETPEGDDIRPTSDKVRGSVFNILRGRGVLHGARVMDVFCGTGALGLEALSNGAASCVFVDSEKRSLNLARRNVEALGAQGGEFILQDVQALKARGSGMTPMELVFMDPPYGEGLVVLALEALDRGGWLADGCVVVVEVEKGFSGGIGAPFVIEDERSYGRSKVLFLRYKG